MQMWILLGVLAIALVAIIIRFAFGSSGKRRAPVVFESQGSKNPGTVVANEPNFAHDNIMSSRLQDEDGTISEAAATATGNSTVNRLEGNPRLNRSGHSIFSDFRGIVDSDSSLNTPEPEELPINDDDLVFGDATPALAQMLPETASRKAAVIAAPLVGWAIPPLLVSSKATERRGDIERGLPDALDMLNMGVSQGLTVQSSLKRIGPEIEPAHPALAQELKIVNQQAHVGSLNQALSNFAKRMDSPEVSSFTSLLIQSESTGTSISRALSDYSDSMRSTIRERADSRANAASFKLLFPTVLCLMPSVFMFLLGPAVVSLSDFANNTANELIDSRQNALDSLETAPQFSPVNQ